MGRFASAPSWWALLAAAALVALPVAAADAFVLVLDDGQEIRGVDLERGERGEYLLTLDTGARLSLPATLVVEVRLIGAGAPEETETERDPEPEPEPEGPTDDVEPEPRPEREPPTGFEVGSGRELTGSPTDGRTAPVTERLAALPGAGRSRFARGALDPSWTPTSDWDETTDVTNFNPARWYRAPIDPTWTPASAFDGAADVLSGGRSTFQRSLIDPTWIPTSGFRSGSSEDRADEGAVSEPASLVEGGGRYVPAVRFDEP